MTPEPIDEKPGLSDALRSAHDTPRPAYDVCTPDKLPADRVGFVDAIVQQFLETLAQELTAYLDTPVAGIPAEAVQMPLSEFLGGDGAHAAILTLELSPMQGHAWIGLSGGFLFRVLDILLGAPQTATPTARTSITEIEQHVLREFFHVLVTTLDAAWKPSGIHLRMSSIDSADEVRKTANLDGTALILNCKTKFGEAEESFRVAVPVLAIRLAALENERSNAAQVTSETTARAVRLNVLSGATLQMEAVLGGSSIRLGDIATMQPGQILMLSQPAGAQLDCLVNGKPKYRGEWIAHGDRHGLQVESLLDSSGSVKA